MVTTLSVGYDHIDLATAKKNNVQIGYTPDVLTDATADLTVLLTLAAARKMKQGIRAVEQGEVSFASGTSSRSAWLLNQGGNAGNSGVNGDPTGSAATSLQAKRSAW